MSQTNINLNNTVNIAGNLVEDFTLRTNEDGKKFGYAKIAINRYKTKDGTNIVDYINVLFTNKPAEEMAKLKKGQGIQFSGSLYVKEYVDRDAKRRDIYVKATGFPFKRNGLRENFGFIVGNVTADPQIVKTKTGEFAAFTVAATRNYTEAGTNEYKPDYIEIRVYETKSVNFVKNYVKKGTHLNLHVELQTYNYTDREANRSKTVVVANKVSFGNYPRKKDNNNSNPLPSTTEEAFNQPQFTAEELMGNTMITSFEDDFMFTPDSSEFTSILATDDDDLPF